MTASLRQSELFAGENWQQIYQAFTQINFSSYDFDTIRESMVEYIQRFYGDDFNDWIENQELVFIIDMIAYLGQSLAFRTDLNSRENFLDTAERRESILRLAKMLGYSPKRNYPARGLLKLRQVKTTEEIYDSNDINLSNRYILWNDPDNGDWYEQFITVLNSAFISTNPFGSPVSSGLVGGITTQLYKMNNVTQRTVADRFTSTINGQGMNFEICNTDFDNLGFFKEKTPNPLSRKHIVYRNDGSGNSSPNTGFFTYFKQGELQYKDFEFIYPQENRVIDIDIDNINELDVWVQEISESGTVIKEWTKVPTVENVAYNSIDRQVREIYQVVTRDNDRISIRFGDGRFGKSPTGIFRIWYRVSNGLSYQIRSSEMRNVEITIPYTKTGQNGRVQEHSLTLSYSLEYGISNRDVGGSLPRETAQQIKTRAPQVYYTQNRMVNGEDYNSFPLQFGNTVRKVKAINRVYSGHSRYIDINDPTGRYQNTSVFSDDGILYREFFNRSDFETLPTNKSPTEIIESRIQPLLDQIDLRDFFYSHYPRYLLNGNPYPMKWYNHTSSNVSSSGEFRVDILNNNNFVSQPIGSTSTGTYRYLTENSLVRFVDPQDGTNFKWVKIEQVQGDGTDPNILTAQLGPVVLSENVPMDWDVNEVIPAFYQSLVDSEIDLIAEQIELKNTFGLRYDDLTGGWKIITTNNIDLTGNFSLSYAGDTTNNNLDASWLLLVEYLPGNGFWSFKTRNLRYIFESEQDVSFFFVNDYKVVDTQRNLALLDFIKILKFNTYPKPDLTPLGTDYHWRLVQPIVYEDGFIDPKRVQISFSDMDDDGVPDNPDIFDIIVDPTLQVFGADIRDRYVFFKQVIENGYEVFLPTDEVTAFVNFTDINPVGLEDYEVVFAIDNQTFYEKQPNNSLVNVSENYNAYIGRKDINYQWKHYAPEDNRIDPAITNIIDTYVLTETYYQTVQDWTNSLNRGNFPKPPTSDDLRIQFSELEKFKMISDEIIWNSAKFKLLFGEGAIDDLRAQFKVIKLQSSTLSDNEIKQRVIESINQFFNVNNWSFGETFYVTELCAYVHQQLATEIASIVIVPQKESSKFGNLFVVRAEPNELFLNTASVNDILIVNNYNSGNIKIGN